MGSKNLFNKKQLHWAFLYWTQGNQESIHINQFMKLRVILLPNSWRIFLHDFQCQCFEIDNDVSLENDKLGIFTHDWTKVQTIMDKCAPPHLLFVGWHMQATPRKNVQNHDWRCRRMIKFFLRWVVLAMGVLHGRCRCESKVLWWWFSFFWYIPPEPLSRL